MSSCSVLSQEIGWEERLRNDLFCFEWDGKPQLNHVTVYPYWNVKYKMFKESPYAGPAEWWAQRADDEWMVVLDS